MGDVYDASTDEEEEEEEDWTQVIDEHHPTIVPPVKHEVPVLPAPLAASSVQREATSGGTREKAGIVSRMRLNDNKAGMEGLDRERINKIIYEASKGSRFYENEQKREQQVTLRIEEQRKRLEQLTEAQIAQAVLEADSLLASVETSRHLSRSIVHIDMDAFYAAVEMRDDPALMHVPMAVGGNDMLSTSNYLARRYGVRAGMPGFIGRKLCPPLVIVPCNFDKYTAVSKEVRAVMATYDPNFSPMSLDEAYLDFTKHLEKRRTSTVEERTYRVVLKPDEVCTCKNNTEHVSTKTHQSTVADGKTDKISNKNISQFTGTVLEENADKNLTRNSVDKLGNQATQGGEREEGTGEKVDRQDVYGQRTEGQERGIREQEEGKEGGIGGLEEGSVAHKMERGQEGELIGLQEGRGQMVRRKGQIKETEGQEKEGIGEIEGQKEDPRSAEEGKEGGMERQQEGKEGHGKGSGEEEGKRGEEGGIVERCNVCGGYVDVTAGRHDLFGTDVQEAVREMRARIHWRTKLTASAGIAPNTLLAKVCSDKNKPNGQYYLPPDRQHVMDFMAQLDIRKVCGIGKVAERMLRSLGVEKCCDLYVKRGVLCRLYSKISFNYFMRIALGVGSTTVDRDGERKSMSVERTFKELHDPKDLYEKCLELSESLSEDLQQENLVGKTVGIKLKTVTFDLKTRARSVSMATNQSDVIYKAASELLRTEIQLIHPKPLRLRLMGVRMSNLSPKPAGTNHQQQSSIKSMLAKIKVNSRSEDLALPTTTQTPTTTTPATHVDACLNRTAIKQILSQQQGQQPATSDTCKRRREWTSNDQKSAKKKKSNTKTIESFFKRR